LSDDAERADGYFSKFNVSGLLRGDAASRATYYASGINDGWMTRNEARSLEDLNPMEGLDEPLQPLNMVTIEQAKVAADTAAKAADAAAKADAAAAKAASQPAPAPAPAPTPSAPDGKALAIAIAREIGAPQLEEKVGRALSARNEGRLVDARDLITEVLAEVAAVDDAATAAKAKEMLDEAKRHDDAMAAIGKGLGEIAKAMRAPREVPPVKFVRDDKGRVLGAEPLKG
jgi:hypothetical protein